MDNTSTINHTYLRYECLDTFGIAIAGGGTSSKTPITHQILATVPVPPPQHSTQHHSTTTTTTLCYTAAGSIIHVWDIDKSHQPIYKIGHSSVNHNIGTGQALNDNEITCLDVIVDASRCTGSDAAISSSSSPIHTIATGYMDGSVRIYEINAHDILTASSSNSSGTCNTLLSNTNEEKSSLLWQNSNPLLLQGHTSPIRCITFNHTTSSTTAAVTPSSSSKTTSSDSSTFVQYVLSGSNDGVIIVWDIINECGLFRLLGHSGPISQLQWITATNTATTVAGSSTVTGTSRDYILSSCIGDSLMKVWDIQQQCCIQTITKYRNHSNHNSTSGHAGGSDYTLLPFVVIPTMSSSSPLKLITGGNQCMVWSIGGAHDGTKSSSTTSTAANMEDIDSICQYMGALLPPSNMVGGIDTTTANSRIACIQYTTDRRYLGILLQGENGNMIDIYRVLSPIESSKKRTRRLKRRQEKMKKREKPHEPNLHDPTTSKRRGILDEDDHDDDEDKKNGNDTTNANFDPELLQVTDEFEYVTRVNVTAASTSTSKTKIRGFRFIQIVPSQSKKKRTTKLELCRIICANTNNTMETYSILQEQDGEGIAVEQVQLLDYYGHTTGIRYIALSSKDQTCCTISKNHVKFWNVHTRSCISSIPLVAATTMVTGEGMDHKKIKKATKKRSYYGLCALFLPGDTHVVIGTREGTLLLCDIHSNEMIYVNDAAHTGPIWSVDIKNPSSSSMNTSSSSTVVIVTGSADHQVKFWNVESSTEEEDNVDETFNRVTKPMLRHTRTLQMTDDVVAVRYSHSTDPARRMIFVTTLDSTIKVFFDDTLKMFLSLYGHKLPALTIDCSDDDTILASGGADKTIKIWGLDFGDTHRTLHGHTDSITDLRFVRHTHYFFTCSKDNTVRYWDGDRFEQILLLSGHSAEVNCLAISRTGAFVLSAGMDRQIRVWERTKDIVFLEEERERELEQMFDRVNNRDEGGTGSILDRKVQQGNDNEDDDGMMNEDEPQSEAAVRKSVTSVACGDRIMEAIERADQEMKDIATFRRAHGPEKKRSPNMMMLSLEPAPYILWVLRTIKSAEIEQSLILLSLRHIERLMYYLIILLKAGQGIELCSRVAVFLVKAHQNQVRKVNCFCNF